MEEILATQTLPKVLAVERLGRAGKVYATIDGNKADAFVATQVSQVAAIHSITPSLPMGEACRPMVERGQALDSRPPSLPLEKYL